MSALQEVADLTARVAGEVGPAVVGLGRGWGRGSGLVIESGRVLTNAHNLRHDEVTVSLDGTSRTGRVSGSDPDLDLAVIELDTGGVEPIGWPAGSATGGDTPDQTLQPGRFVLALANPGGRGLRVTPGFVAATSRSFRGPRGRRIRGAIEHTAPLPPGSSGGPLVDGEGNLLGINTLRVEGGLILAIAADAVLRERVEALGRGETPRRARLGVAVAPPRVARRLRRSVGLPEREGVLVRAVEDDSPASRAGVERGDLIAALGERPIDSVDALYEALDQVRSGGSAKLLLVRGEQEREVELAF